MPKASKIRSTPIRKSTEMPKTENRNRTSKPRGTTEEKNAIADDIKSTLAAYNRQQFMQRAYDEEVAAGNTGNYGEDGFLIKQEYESGYESVVGVPRNPGYDKPVLVRASEAVVVEQDESSGIIKVTKDKNYHQD